MKFLRSFHRNPFAAANHGPSRPPRPVRTHSVFTVRRPAFWGLLGAVMLIAGACEDRVELDLPEGEEFLVVDGWITNEPGPQTVLLTRTTAYFDAAPQPTVSGATVVIRDDQGLETTLTETQSGVYVYPDSGTVGRSYQLDIALPDGSRYLSDFEDLRPPVPIFDIYSQLSEDEPDTNDGQNPDDIYDVLIDTAEPPGLGDYYRWQSVLNGVVQTGPFDLNVSSDDLVDGSPIPEFNVTDELYSAGDTVTIIQEHISEAAYNFFTAVVSQTAFVGSPFDPPPSPIAGNVHNVDRPDRDALGFFGASGRVRATVVVGPE